MYVGMAVLNTMQDKEIFQHKNLCRDFYSGVGEFLVTATTEIRKYYDFNDELLQCTSIFHYERCRDIDLTSSYTFIGP